MSTDRESFLLIVSADLLVAGWWWVDRLHSHGYEGTARVLSLTIRAWQIQERRRSATRCGCGNEMAMCLSSREGDCNGGGRQ
jgi:hypothetical protein